MSRSLSRWICWCLLRRSMFNNMHLRPIDVVVYTVACVRVLKWWPEKKSRVRFFLQTIFMLLLQLLLLLLPLLRLPHNSVFSGCCFIIPEIACIHFCFLFTSVAMILFAQFALLSPTEKWLHRHKHMYKTLGNEKFTHLRRLCDLPRRCLFTLRSGVLHVLSISASERKWRIISQLIFNLFYFFLENSLAKQYNQYWWIRKKMTTWYIINGDSINS